MLLKYLDKPELVKAQILFNCDQCHEDYTRAKKSYEKMQKSTLYDKDYCLRCWQSRFNRANRDKMSQAVKLAYVNNPALRERQSYSHKKFYDEHPEKKVEMSQILKNIYKENPEIKEKISKSVKQAHDKDPSIRQRISKTLILHCVNRGEKNGMKNLYARKKVSEARKKMFKDPATRALYSEKTRKAWADGKFDGVAVGQCKWYNYKHSNGNIYKVQGTWELAFIKWLDNNNLTFKCHRGWIPYILNKKKKNWYPDFWVDEWDSYVDVKCEHFYNKEKFDAILLHNPEIKIRILFKKDLLSLGVIL